MGTIGYTLWTGLEDELDGRPPTEWPAILRRLGDPVKQNFDTAARAIEVFVENGEVEYIVESVGNWKSVSLRLRGPFNTPEEAKRWLIAHNLDPSDFACDHEDGFDADDDTDDDTDDDDDDDDDVEEE